VYVCFFDVCVFLVFSFVKKLNGLAECKRELVYALILSFFWKRWVLIERNKTVKE